MSVESLPDKIPVVRPLIRDYRVVDLTSRCTDRGPGTEERSRGRYTPCVSVRVPSLTPPLAPCVWGDQSHKGGGRTTGHGSEGTLPRPPYPSEDQGGTRRDSL